MHPLPGVMTGVRMTTGERLSLVGASVEPPLAELDHRQVDDGRTDQEGEESSR